MLKMISQGKFRRLQLDRPDLHNAFNPEMIAGIHDFFVAAAQDSDVRAIVLEANGKSFCAGADLQWMQQMQQYSAEENQQDAVRLYEMFEAIYQCPVPVIARVQGAAYGGGLGLIAACDIAAAELSCRFAFTEVQWGLSPATISPFVLEKMSMSAAREYFLTGKSFSAPEAQSMGLLRFVGEQSEVDSYIESLLQNFASAGPQALRATKSLFRSYLEKSRAENKLYTASVIAACRTSEEGQQGLQYFLTKKLPTWKEQ